MGVQAGARDPEDVRQQDLRVDLRLRDAGGLEHGPSLARDRPCGLAQTRTSSFSASAW